MKSKNLFLLLAIVGFIGPNIFVALEFMESGNFLLYTNLPETFAKLFANHASTAFVVDLLLIVMLFLGWSWVDAKEKKMKTGTLIGVWVVTFAFGLAAGLPLYLYLRSAEKSTS